MLFLFFRFLILFFSISNVSLFCEEIPRILVSVAPYKFFVEQIADGTVEVDLMVPAGASMHTFEPTPKQMLHASKAVIWFQIGESFEPHVGRALQSHQSRMQFVNLRNQVDLIVDAEASCHCCPKVQDSCIDPHIWLSARQMKIQIQTIAKTLSEHYPQNASRYGKNLENLLNELDVLDKEISQQLAGLQNRTILVSHPAYAYFCRDYNLRQLSIEFEGKDPTPQQLTKLLLQARQSQAKKIFIQPQYNSKGARLIAQEIGAKVVALDPYAEAYFKTMREIASQFATNSP